MKAKLGGDVYTEQQANGQWVVYHSPSGNKITNIPNREKARQMVRVICNAETYDVALIIPKSP